MSNRGSFDQVIKPGGRMPKGGGSPKKDKKDKPDKKGGKKMPFPPKKGARKVAV